MMKRVVFSSSTVVMLYSFVMINAVKKWFYVLFVVNKVDIRGVFSCLQKID